MNRLDPEIAHQFLLSQAVVYLECRAFSSAHTLLATCQILFHDSKECLMLLALASLELQKPDEASRVLVKLEENYPEIRQEWPEYWLLQARISYATRAFDTSRQLLTTYFDTCQRQD